MSNETKASIFLIAAVLTFILPFLLFPKFLRSSKSNIVRPNFTVTYLGLLCTLQSVLYLGAGIQSKLWAEIDQIGFWVILVIVPLSTGLLMLRMSSKWRLVFDENVINFYPLLGKLRSFSWTNITSIKPKFSGLVVIRLSNNQTIAIWETYENVGLFLQAVSEKQIPIIGYQGQK